MRALIACALFLASCAKGGVEIVVTGASGEVNHVHLFVGVGDAYTEPINTGKRAFPFPKSTAFARDDYNELDVRDVKSTDAITFQFQGSGKLGVLIAIATNGDTPVSAGVLRVIEIPSDYVARYEIKLEAVSSSGTTSPLELDVWEPTVGSPKEGKVCVALFDKRTMSADAVVTDGDPDCDGWPTGDAKECQPNLYMSYKRPTLQDAACLALEQSPENSTVTGCVLGGPACADGHGKEASCNAPTPYCTLKSVCNQCIPRGVDAWNCARDVTSVGAPTTHLHCKLHVDATGALCTSTFKALANPMGIGGRFCRSGSEQITTIGQPWGTDVAWNEGGKNFGVKIANLEPSCNFDITPSGSFGTNRLIYGGLVAAMLDNGRGIAIPIVFEIDPLSQGCDTPVVCQTAWSWDVTELVDNCVNAPVYPP